MPDEEKITKRRVTMRTAVAVPGMTDSKGKPVVVVNEAVDYVPDDDRNILEPYVAEARLRWQTVEVSEEYDAGPGGYHGQTAVPKGANLRNPDGTPGPFRPFPHPMAGQVFEATAPVKKKD